MKKVFLSSLLLVITNWSFAQTGIGTTTPHASAKLEVNATDKGFLPPRVALTAINSASPIINPANGLMVFNTVTAGTNPYQVVPGYYYWDGTGQQWVSLSTTVGNVQNQAVFRSTTNISAGSAINSWNSRFNNIASGDLTVISNTTFTLSNGIYKIQWGLPHQQANTYNAMQLQELTGGVWNAWMNDFNLGNVANGGGTDWGGTTFMTDIIDCSSSSRTLRVINSDGSRNLYYGASLIITKLNPSITTSTTADNLGNHTATKNMQLSGNYISNDGDNEGIRITNNGQVGIGTSTPTVPLEVNGTINASILNLNNTTVSPAISLKNGDAALAFSDNAQIKMGWAGSVPGTSQYAHFIHTRHNAGTTENAIDFYLSNGTANNTITSGSTKAMSIESPGNLTVAGKINLTDPTGNVAVKAAGFVNAGVSVSLGDIQVQMATGGQRSLLIRTTGTNFTGMVTAYTSYNGASGTNAYTYFSDIIQTITGTFAYLGTTWGFAQDGDVANYFLRDTTNQRFYRITLMVGYGFANNFISIERLL